MLLRNRSQIIPRDLIPRIKEAKSIGNTSRDSVTEILKDYTQNDSSEVKFDGPVDNDSDIDTLRSKEIKSPL
jgi:hypothetical protein